MPNVQLYEQASDMTLIRANGETFRLFDQPWDKETVLVVYRTIGCPVCRKYLKQLQDELPLLEQAGARVIAISADSAANVARMREEHQLTFQMGGGLDRETAARYGLYWNEQNAHAEPGLFILDRDNRFLYASVQSFPLGRVDVKEITRLVQFFRNMGDGNKLSIRTA